MAMNNQLNQLVHIVNQLIIKMNACDSEAFFYQCNDMKKWAEESMAPASIMVMGNFSVGKSTLINALLEKEVAHIDVSPATAVITVFKYSAIDRTVVHNKDGEIREYSSDSFARLTAETSKQDIRKRSNIQYVERFLDSPLLQKYTLIDSPGLASNQARHDGISLNFANQADAILWVVSANWAAGKTELSYLEKVKAPLKILIVNQMDMLDEDEDDPEEFLAEIRQEVGRYVVDVVGVSAQMARIGQKQKNDEFLAESNIYDLLNCLQDHLGAIKEQKINHILKNLAIVMRPAFKILQDIDDNIHKLASHNYNIYITKWQKELELSHQLFQLKEFLNSKLSYINEPSYVDELIQNINLSIKGFLSKESKYIFEALRGNSAAQYQEALFCQPNMLGAIYWLKKSAEQAYLPAVRSLYEYYEQRSVLDALPWYELATELGDEQAILSLALIYYNGRGNVKENKEKAVPWLEKAVLIKNKTAGEAMYDLACLYAEGEYVPLDDEKAYKLYVCSHKNGYHKAIVKVADCLYHGQGTSQDRLQAFLLYKESESQQQIDQYYKNNENASDLQKEIGFSYANGKNGFSKDDEQAAYWLELAFYHGNAEAGYMRAQLFSPDDTNAYIWYVRSANKGYGPAQMVYGDHLLQQKKRFHRLLAIRQYFAALIHGVPQATGALGKQLGILAGQGGMLIFILYIFSLSPLLYAKGIKTSIISGKKSEVLVNMKHPAQVEKDIIRGCLWQDENMFKDMKQQLIENEKIQRICDNNPLVSDLSNIVVASGFNFSTSKSDFNYHDIHITAYQIRVIAAPELNHTISENITEKNKLEADYKEKKKQYNKVYREYCQARDNISKPYSKEAYQSVQGMKEKLQPSKKQLLAAEQARKNFNKIHEIRENCMKKIDSSMDDFTLYNALANRENDYDFRMSGVNKNKVREIFTERFDGNDVILCRIYRQGDIITLHEFRVPYYYRLQYDYQIYAISKKIDGEI